MQFPNQMLTEQEKKKKYGSIKNWAKEVFNSIDSTSTRGRYTLDQERYQMQILYELRAGQLLADDYTRVLNELGIRKSGLFPATIKNYPLIPQICNELLGEEIKQPFNFMAVQVNEDVVSNASKEKNKQVQQWLMSMLAEEIAMTGDVSEEEMNPQAFGPGTDFKSKEEIEKYVNTTWRDKKEIQVQHALNFIYPYCEVKRKMEKGFDHLVTVGREVFYVGSYSNEPNLRVCNPLFVDYDRSPDLERIEDAGWVREVEFIPAHEVRKRYYKELTEEDSEKIESMKGQSVFSNTYNSAMWAGGTQMNYNQPSANNLFYHTAQTSTLIEVTHLCWIGLEKVIFISYVDEDTGMLVETKVDESYKKTGKELSYEVEWLDIVYQATRIGPPSSDIYVEIGPRPNQSRSMDNPNKCKMPYIGLAHKYPNAGEISIVNMLRQLQYLYNVLWYRLELALAWAKGKVMLFDIAQIPGDFGGVERWIEYIATNNIAFIDSAKEGNRDKVNQFNQFKEFDLTLSAAVGQYMNIISMIEVTAGQLVGVSLQRRGTISASETVSNVNTSITQSATITEYLYSSHNDCKRRVLTALVEEAKMCWKNGKKGQYVLSETDRVLFDIDPESFSDTEIGIFINNAAKDVAALDMAKELAHAALQNNQAKLSDILAAMRSTSMAQATSILKQAEEDMATEQQAMAQQAQQAETERTQMQIQATNNQLDIQYQMHKEKLENNIEVAEINALKSAQDPDSNDNNIPDVLEVEKLREEKRKNMTNEALKAADLKNKNKKIDAELAKASLDAQMKQKEINLKKQKGSGI